MQIIKNLKYKLLLFIVFSVGFFSEAKVMTLEECLDSALEANIQIRAGILEVEKNKILTGTAFDAPNTGIELTQDATEGGGMENGLKFSQEFDFPTVYVAKRRVLKAAVGLASAQLDNARNEIYGNVLSAYYNSLYLKHLKSLLERRLDYLRQFTSIAHMRFEAGESSMLEVLNAERVEEKARMEFRDASLRFNDSANALGAFVGMNTSVEPADEDLYALECPDLLDFPDFSITSRGKIFEAQIKQSERNVFLAKQEFMPGLSISATSQLLIKGFNPYGIDRQRFEKGNFMGFSIGITVPLFFGANLSRLIAAKRDVEIVKLHREDELLRLAVQYRSLKEELNSLIQNLSYFEQSAISKAAEIRRLARISYQLGEIDYLEFMQNMSTASEIETDYLECLNSYNQCVIKIQTITGR